MTNPLEGKKLELDYPTDWTFKLIGTDESAVRKALLEVIGDREHRFEPSNESKNGRYLSFTLVLSVHSDEDRTGIGNQLHAHKDIRFVL